MKIGDNLYKLVNGKKRKFTPIGVQYDLHYLTPGIWLCTNKPNVFSCCNLNYRADELGLYRVGNVPEVDYVKIAEIKQLGDEICDIIYNFKQEHQSYSLQELSEHIASKLMELSKS